MMTSIVVLYIDPGTGALLWQLLVAAGLGLLFYLRKVRLWIRGVLRLDRAPEE